MKKQKKKSTNSALSSTSKKPYAQNKDTAEGRQSLRAMDTHHKKEAKGTAYEIRRYTSKVPSVQTYHNFQRLLH